jgi:hypothetical protein
MAKKKYRLPFDTRGGVVAVMRRMLESEAYRALSLPARCLLLELQVHWSNDKAVAFGTREAAEKLSCDRRVAMRAFDELRKAGFIHLEDESLFNSRTGSKARTWVLTWMPYLDRPPSNDWELSKKSSST